GNGEVPAAERCGRLVAVTVARRQGGYVELALDGRIVAVAERVGVGPVAHEDGVAGLPDAARLFFLIGEDAGRRDRADPALDHVEGGSRLRIVDRDRAVGLDDLAAAARLDPLERVAGQAFVGVALEDEAPHVLVAGFALL